GFLEAFHCRHVDRRLHGGVFNEIAQVRVFVVTDRGFHGDRLFGDLQYLADLVLGHFHALAQLFRSGLAAHFLQHLARDAVELVDRLDHVHRDTDGARLVGDRAGDRLANPPGGVGRELVTATVFELVHRLHQADVAFLNQVEELQPAVGVLLGNRDHQTQVGLAHFLLGAAGLGLADGHAAVDVLDLSNRQADFVFEVDQLLLVALDVVLQIANGFGVFRLALGQAFAPGQVDFVVREQLEEVGTRHARVTHAQLHDGAFLLAHAVQGAAHGLDQGIVLLGYELDRHEQDAQGVQLGIGLLAATAVFFQGLVRNFQQVGNSREPAQGFFRVRAAITFLFGFLGLGLFLFFVVLVLGRRRGRLGDDRRYFLGGQRAIVRVDIAVEDIGQATAFGADALVFGKNAIDDAGEVGHGNHDFTDTFLDALGDFDFAFAGQQLNGTHFAHVH